MDRTKERMQNVQSLQSGRLKSEKESGIIRRGRSSLSTKKGTKGTDKTTDRVRLLPLAETDHLLQWVALWVVVPTWLFLLVFIYSICPTSKTEGLDDLEAEIATGACCIFAVSIAMNLIPVLVKANERQIQSKKKQLPHHNKDKSGILVCMMVIQIIALITNGLIAFGPAVVVRDPVTHAKVSLVRWCEWTPLSGLMAFMADGIDMRKDDRGFGMTMSFGVAIGQSISCLCAIILPFCPNVASWALIMTLSLGYFSTIIPRLWMKYCTFRRQRRGCTISEFETYYRIKAAYDLLLMCSICWTCFIALYFASMIGKRFYPEEHWMHSDSLSMMADTFFDLLSKFLYMKVIFEVHQSVFDSDVQTARKLAEYQNLMTTLWNTSSDVIVISIRDNDAHGNNNAENIISDHRITTFISPTFAEMVVGDLATLEDSFKEKLNLKSLHWVSSPINSSSSSSASTALMVEGYSDNLTGLSHPEVSFVSTTKALYPIRDRNDQTAGLVVVHPVTSNGGDDEGDTATTLGPSGLLKQEAAQLAAVLCATEPTEQILFHSVNRRILEPMTCEMKVLQKQNESSGVSIAILRDVTERYREEHLQSYLVSQQNDAPSVNRFTRHEIENGLLAGTCHFAKDCMAKPFSAHEFDVAELVTRKTYSLKRLHLVHLCHCVSALWIQGIEVCDYLRSAGTEDAQLSQAKLGKQPPNVETDSAHQNNHNADIPQCVKELQGTLHDILDIVLGESIARDVVDKVYQPKQEEVDVTKLLQRTTRMQEGADLGRFTLDVVSSERHSMSQTIPLLRLDPQLLRYIHRNAISNACMFGKSGGAVRTEVLYDAQIKEMELNVINLPGEMHVKLLAMGADAERSVFLQGKRLHEEGFGKSSGNGAWIMEQCAQSLGGYCSIRFGRKQTIFTFRCPAEAIHSPTQPSHESFTVPAGTFGIGLDDSRIQRRVLTRVLTDLGVESANRLIIGDTPGDVEDFESTLKQILSKSPSNYVLAIVDENLDYHESHGKRLSGSKLIERVLAKLKPSQEARLLALIRSADDSTEDVALYRSRAHNVFPKSSMSKEATRDVMASLWQERFHSKKRARKVNEEFGSVTEEESSESSSSMSDLISEEELLESLARVQSFLKENRNAPWTAIWSRLHVLKGDLMAIAENESAAVAADLINDLRGGENGEIPRDFSSKWEAIQSTTLEAAEKLPSNPPQ